ncbi:MAG: DNA alkylation repair protein [Bacteroidia bacterium]|nr:DNA alkylation repair protein [Bacteroidia bacterium]
MKPKEVIALLEAHKNERGIANWEKMNTNGQKLKSFGIGLTHLRKLAKQIGRDHDLARELWESEYYDAKIISLLIDEPKKITPEQAEKQVEQLEGGYLAHVFSSCDATLAKTSFTKEIADKWMMSEDPVRRRCGFGLLYEMSKSKKRSAPDDEYFLAQIKHIEQSFDDEPISLKMAMGGALQGIGMRNLKLNKAALKVARKMGPIDFDERGKCDPFNVAKNLTSDYAKKKFGI